MTGVASSHEANALEQALELLGPLLVAHTGSAVFERGYLQVSPDVDEDGVTWGQALWHAVSSEADALRLVKTLFVSERVFHLAVRLASVQVDAGAVRPPPVDGDGLAPPPKTHAVTGAAKVKGHFAIGEVERMRAAATKSGEGSPGLWLRRVVREAVRVGRPLADAPNVVGKAISVEFRCDSFDVEAIDRAAGIAARNAYIRAAALAALNGH